MDVHIIRQALVLKAFWWHVSDPELSQQQCRELAAKELAAEHRQQHQDRRLAAASVPLPPLRGQKQSHHDEPDPQSTLIRKVCACIARLHKPPRRVRIAEPATQPTPPPGPSLLDRIVESFEPALPEPQPERPLVQVPGSNAQLITDLPHRSGGEYAVDNWRRSIEINNVIDLENRQRVQSQRKLNLYVG